MLKKSHYFDEKLDAQYQAMASEFSEQNFSIISQSSDKSVSIVLSSGVDNPASYYIAKNGQNLELLKYAYPTLPSKGLATGVKIQYQTRRNKWIQKNQDAIYKNTNKEGCNIISLKQRNQDRGNAAQPGGPSTDGPADCVSSKNIYCILIRPLTCNLVAINCN